MQRRTISTSSVTVSPGSICSTSVRTDIPRFFAPFTNSSRPESFFAPTRPPLTPETLVSAIWTGVQTIAGHGLPAAIVGRDGPMGRATRDSSFKVGDSRRGGNGPAAAFRIWLVDGIWRRTEDQDVDAGTVSVLAAI